MEYIKTHRNDKGREYKKAGEASWLRTRVQYQETAKKMITTRDKNIKFNKGNPYSRTKSGKRADLDNKFFRSSWEANYARYLNHVGIKWEYEKKRFWFDAIKTGTRSYVPDFYLTDLDIWVEIKGWMDAQSKTRLKRFAKFYPKESKKLSLIQSPEYNKIKKDYSSVIKFWE